MFYALIQGIMLVGLLAFTDLQAYTRLEAYRLVPGQILQINMWFFKKWKVGGSRALKETFPNLNTPQYSRLSGQFEKIMCETKVPLLLSQDGETPK